MIRGLYIAASGMITRQVQQENLSNDVANINTPGYKKDKTVLKTFEEVMIENKDRIINGKAFKNPIGKMNMGVAIDDVKTDYSQGVLEETYRNLDFAINGEGFFTVVDNNNKYYTRDGRFKIDTDGNLITVDGYKVLGINERNNQVPIKIKDSDFKLSSDGSFDSANGKMRFLISSLNEQDLQKSSSNLFKSNSQPRITTSDVRQGFLEKSNVDSIEVITNMITIMRNYESSQKIIQQMDETLGKTVNEVGSLR
ncbi:MAG: flagellar hook-basal body complex protein [Caloramator sp.]|nr:flagellar hook-basal body complex protein [Caloramator sp.]